MLDENVEGFLEHFGVKGQKWGIRNHNLDRISRVAGGTVTRKTNHQAQKDAKEFARAKMFYGEGAGTRRKLIRETVEARKKKDSSYAKVFEEHLNAQDMSQHASKARTERSITDKKKTVRKTSSSLLRRITGEHGTNAAMVAAAAVGVAYLKSDKGKVIMNKSVAKVKLNYSQFNDLFIKLGLKQYRG